MGAFPNDPRLRIGDASIEQAKTTVLFTVDEVAQQLRVSRSKIYGLIAQGKLSVHRLPAIRISQANIRELLDSSRSGYRSAIPRPTTTRLKHLR